MSILSWAIALTTITISWPQIWVSCVRSRTSGLSPLSTWLGPCLNACWLSYGLTLGDPLQIVVNGLMGAGNLAVLAALLLTTPAARRGGALLRGAGLPAVLLASVATVDFLRVTGPLGTSVAAGVLGGLGAIFGAISVLPQPVALLRDRLQDVSGISSGRYLLAAASGSLWLIHGVHGGETAVILSSILGFGSAAVVLHCLLASQRRDARVQATPLPRLVLAA